MKKNKKIVTGRKSKSAKYGNRIAVDPQILAGKPIINGTRISVEFIVKLLRNGWRQEQILENYPNLSNEDILAAIQGVKKT